MKVTFLGTAAANAYPEAFCSCANCAQARQLGGPSLRRRAALLINDDLLIDLGPDIQTACAWQGLSLERVRYCLQTHPHADHLDASHLLSRSPEYGTVGAARLHFYASPATLHQVDLLLERDIEPGRLRDPQVGDRLNLAVHPVSALDAFDAGPYRITAFPANHDPVVEPLLYAIAAGGRCIFYGTDTAALPEANWHAFHQHGLRFDLVILDHTYGPGESGTDHLSARQVGEHVARLRLEGLLAENGCAFATHIAHQGNPPHPQLAASAAQGGYEVAYDGLVLEL